MSDEGEAVNETKNENEAPQEEESELITSCKAVIKKALLHDGLARGLHETVKALDQRKGHLCIMASNCDQQQYTA